MVKFFKVFIYCHIDFIKKYEGENLKFFLIKPTKNLYLKNNNKLSLLIKIDFGCQRIQKTQFLSEFLHKIRNFYHPLSNSNKTLGFYFLRFRAAK